MQTKAMRSADLFDPPPPYQRHSTTSKVAASAILPNAKTLRAAVLNYLRAYGGATDDEIQAALNMSGNTERPRRRELEQHGLVRDSGRRRLTHSGRQAVVWEAAVAS